MDSYRAIAEDTIETAIQNGEFDQLQGEGQPLHMDDYLTIPVEQRMSHTVLKNSGFAPPEIDLMSELNALRSTSPNSPKNKQRRIQLETELALRQERFRL